MFGNHCIESYCSTQSTIALSSAEAELSGLVTGATHALGLRSVAQDLGIELDIVLWSDASAAIGIARRKGLGRVRHLDVADLWIQDKLRAGEFALRKVAGTVNPADMLTKYVERPVCRGHLERLNMSFEDGRADSAPQLTANQQQSPEPLSPLLQLAPRGTDEETPRAAYSLAAPGQSTAARSLSMP